jgi:hypothetical protein
VFNIALSEQTKIIMAGVMKELQPQMNQAVMQAMQVRCDAKGAGDVSWG